ncbi:hypothetical protein [Stenotrophomonas oahuensis]|uniref:DUF2059 domain-containing protein n=1 Tax=Stenotrophomonas oahuensis TaxID=3003271 RepID=A0ABY9YPH0_9GAMM|nr:hypothetical protein [Stenotrophomonas sp. A5586]WNH52103.1 hypothetical protein PDM29_17445 [Stenotrophomonas sp. A5586]
MKISYLAFACSVLFGLSSSAGAHEEISSPSQAEGESRDLLQREISTHLAQIKNKEDLQVYLTSMRGIQTPLDTLSPGAKRRFIESLVFTDRGLASFTYVDIRNELTLSEAYKLLALFGREATAASIRGMRVENEADRLISQASAEAPLNDYMDYWCRTTATCTKKLEDICVGPNC